jgi:hypothetical protein
MNLIKFDIPKKNIVDVCIPTYPPFKLAKIDY